MQCPKCGRENPEQTKFCMHCGVRLASDARAATVPSEPGLGRASGSGRVLELGTLRHPKESIYLTIAAIISGFIWLLLIRFVWIYLIPLAVVSWLAGQFFKAQIYGNAVRVSEEQFAEIHRMATDLGAKINLRHIPEIFILSGQGALNAMAIRFFSGRYILLYGELLDLMLRRGAYDELCMILGHELAHHALGHVSIWKNFLLYPFRLIPFLGAAYSRACELSADRVGMVLAGDLEAASRALLALAVGSEALAGKLDMEAFCAQEKYMPPVIGFIHELFSSHPRMTVRIIELKKYQKHGYLSRPVEALTSSAQVTH